MRNLIIALFVAFTLPLFLFAQPKVGHITPVMKKVMEQQQKTKFETFDLFNQGPAFEEYQRLNEVVAEATILELNPKTLADLYQKRPKAITLNLATENGKGMTLDLVRYQIYSEDFKVTTSGSEGAAVAYDQGAFYRGSIRGSQQSLAAISIFDDEVIGVLSSLENGNIVLGKIEKSKAYVLYEERHLKVRNPHEGCQLPEIKLTGEELARMREMAENNISAKSAVGCVRIYFECEYNMYQEKGSVSATTNFMMGAYNGLATLYQNEDINTLVTQVKVWNTPDSYPTSSTPAALNTFSANVQNYGADLAHLVSRGAPTGGGVAWLDGLCDNYYSHAYSHINASYAQLPTYSWTVGVLTHEMGHNLGSPHTQACSWPPGALDNCYTTEGNCSPGPSPTNGGTIMSYCHLNSTGINFNNGFGYYPGNLIRNSVASKSCLTACGDGATCSDGVQNGDETGVDCGGSCPACPTNPTCDDGVQNGDETGVDCGGSCTPCDTGGACIETAVVIVTDYWGAETTWEITDNAGNSIASGGPYSNYYNGYTYYEYECLKPGCYTFTAYDSYGDGMCCESGNGGYWFYDYDQAAYIFSGGDFGYSSSNQFCVGQGNLSFSPAPKMAVPSTTMTLYPNPAKEMVFANMDFENDQAVEVKVVNLAGQVVYQDNLEANQGKNQFGVSVREFPNGYYFLQVSSEAGRSIEKFTVFR